MVFPLFGSPDPAPREGPEGSEPLLTATQVPEMVTNLLQKLQQVAATNVQDSAGRIQIAGQSGQITEVMVKHRCEARSKKKYH